MCGEFGRNRQPCIQVLRNPLQDVADCYIVGLEAQSSGGNAQVDRVIGTPCPAGAQNEAKGPAPYQCGWSRAPPQTATDGVAIVERIHGLIDQFKKMGCTDWIA